MPSALSGSRGIAKTELEVKEGASVVHSERAFESMAGTAREQDCRCNGFDKFEKIRRIST